MNVPFVVIPTTPDTHTNPLLGAPFLSLTNSKLTWYKDRCTLSLGARPKLPPISVELVGKERHPVMSTSSIELLPKASMYIQLTFSMAPHLPTNLDDQEFMLEGDIDCLEVDQVVVPEGGKINVVITNKSQQPYLLLENSHVGTCELMASIQSSISLSPLAAHQTAWRSPNQK